VPAGGKVEFKPGGFHIMFMDLKQPLKQDERLKGTLTFEKAGPVEVEFKVESVGFKGGEAGAHTGH
jgi:copper(I)-binding protein